ncbi:hypothetical protein PV10_08388 [Exophiala mesophila]|uniref:Uncharacterized protein n=1 Tax=Exophiala mesophila TaxID=212818 RepID=A0A0D1XKK9_EXOME|nr:uncharacterized protein PV10_08388 [Exophiala mesophila]KIV88736.1 hypothetical protein PV10_08388 [Exophiala mesophila]
MRKFFREVIDTAVETLSPERPSSSSSSRHRRHRRDSDHHHHLRRDSSCRQKRNLRESDERHPNALRYHGQRSRPRYDDDDEYDDEYERERDRTRSSGSSRYDYDDRSTRDRDRERRYSPQREREREREREWDRYEDRDMARDRDRASYRHRYPSPSPSPSPLPSPSPSPRPVQNPRTDPRSPLSRTFNDDPRFREGDEVVEETNRESSRSQGWVRDAGVRYVRDRHGNPVRRTSYVDEYIRREDGVEYDEYDDGRNYSGGRYRDGFKGTTPGPGPAGGYTGRPGGASAGRDGRDSDSREDLSNIAIPKEPGRVLGEVEDSESGS